MIEYSVQDGQLQLRVQVVPRASRSEVVGAHNGLLRVRIAASPVDGAANEELIKVLAKKFGVAKGAVSIITGHSGRVKQVRIDCAKTEVLERVKAFLASE